MINITISEIVRQTARQFVSILFLCPSLFLLIIFAGQRPLKGQATKPAAANPETEFAVAASALAKAPVDDVAVIQRYETRALGILDTAMLRALAGRADVDLPAVNERIAKFASRKAGAGESYRVVKVADSPVAYALAADFGVDAPSAVRIYSQRGTPGQYVLAARIDRFTQTDLMDDSMEVAPISSAAGVFVTIAGRTDDFKTGDFMAWQFDGQTLHQLWDSDLLEHSSFQTTAAGFEMTYCKEPDEEHLGV
jgi:hypothetical protein